MVKEAKTKKRSRILISLFTSIILSLVLVSAPFSGGISPSLSGGYRVIGTSTNMQFNNPNFFSVSGFTSPDVYWPKFGKEDCYERQDIIMQIAPGGCSPAVVRSDLLEEQPVPVFCKVMAIQANPLIDISRIRSLHFKGQYPKGVSSISYFPARAALRSQISLTSSPIKDNLGYVVIVLSRIEAEKNMPEFIEGNVTAVIDYEAEGVFGIGNTNFYIEEMDDEEWLRNYKEYGFWNGKGYIRVDSIEQNGASISILRDSDTKTHTISLKKGETSRDLYLTGFYCAAGMNVKLENIDVPVDSALLQINDKQIWVAKGDRILDGKCTIEEVKTYGGGGRVKVNCPVGRFDLSLNPGKAEIEVEAPISGKNKIDNYLVGSRVGEFKRNEKTENVWLGYSGSFNNENFIVLVSESYSNSEESFSDKGVYGIIQDILDKNKKKTGAISGLQNDIKEKIEQEYKRKLKTDVSINVKIAVEKVEGDISGSKKNIVEFKDKEEKDTLFTATLKQVLVAKDKDWEKEKDSSALLAKEYYDEAIENYQDLSDFYSSEKMIESEEPYAAQGLYEAAKLSEQFEMKAKANEFYSKLIRDYPDSSSANKASREQELLMKYDSSDSKAVVNINNKQYFIDLLDFKKPKKEDLNAVLMINGKEEVLGKNEIIEVKEGKLQLKEIRDEIVNLEFVKSEEKKEEGKEGEDVTQAKVWEDKNLKEGVKIYVLGLGSDKWCRYSSKKWDCNDELVSQLNGKNYVDGIKFLVVSKYLDGAVIDRKKFERASGETDEKFAGRIFEELKNVVSGAGTAWTAGITCKNSEVQNFIQSWGDKPPDERFYAQFPEIADNDKSYLAGKEVGELIIGSTTGSTRWYELMIMRQGNVFYSVKNFYDNCEDECEFFKFYKGMVVGAGELNGIAAMGAVRMIMDSPDYLNYPLKCSRTNGARRVGSAKIISENPTKIKIGGKEIARTTSETEPAFVERIFKALKGTTAPATTTAGTTPAVDKYDEPIEQNINLIDGHGTGAKYSSSEDITKFVDDLNKKVLITPDEYTDIHGSGFLGIGNPQENLGWILGLLMTKRAKQINDFALVAFTISSKSMNYEIYSQKQGTDLYLSAKKDVNNNFKGYEMKYSGNLVFGKISMGGTIVLYPKYKDSPLIQKMSNLANYKLDTIYMKFIKNENLLPSDQPAPFQAGGSLIEDIYISIFKPGIVETWNYYRYSDKKWESSDKNFLALALYSKLDYENGVKYLANRLQSSPKTKVIINEEIIERTIESDEQFADKILDALTEKIEEQPAPAASPASTTIPATSTKQLKETDSWLIGGNEIKLIKINLKKQAKISITPKAWVPRVESNFKFKIGIEKRAIELSPSRTKEMMENIGKTIKQWSDINEKLGKVIKALKGTCFATAAALTVKNFFTGLSGEAMARNTVMTKPGGWNDFCEKEVEKGNSATVQGCLLKYGSEISESVDSYQKEIEKTNEIMEKIQDKFKKEGSDILDWERQVDALKVDEEFKKEFKNFCDGTSGNIELPDKDKTSVSASGMCDWDTLSLEQRRDIMTLYNTRKNSKPDSVLYDMANKELGRITLDAKSYWETEGARRKADEEAKLYNLNVQTTNIGDDKITRAYIYTVKEEDKTSKGGYSKFDGIDEGNKVIRIFVPGTIPGNEKYYPEHVKNEQVIVKLKTTEGKADRFELDKAYKLDGTELGEKNGLGDVKEYLGAMGTHTFVESSAKAYQNKMQNIGNLKVKYFERAPYKGLPSEVPFDVDNGWYVEMTYVLSGFGKPYDESGRAVNYYICNVGPNGMIEFKRSADDICRYYNGNTAELDFPGMSESESKTLVARAQDAIRQAVQYYGKKEAYINGRKFGTGISFGGEEGRCSDFMSPEECLVMFNVCDPVICPASRCDLGGNFRVDNVIQTGIIGSLALCLPNIREGIIIPICLSGVHAGIENYLSILNSTQACLNESLTTGRNIGICDEIKSIYLCQFFWKQVTPFANVLIPRLIESFFSQGVRGGGEYTTVQSAWDNTQNSINYFKNEYAINSMLAFNQRSTEEIGDDACKSFMSARYPTSKDFFDKLTEPDSPVQYSAWFSEDVLTTATVPATSHYKVYYHIYSGKDQGAYYVVYLKDLPESNYISLGNTYVVDRNYIPRGGEVDQARDFTAVAGYKQLCISVNAQEECGFGKVTTSFALDYLSDKYAEEQSKQTGIRKESECVAGTPSLYSIAQPNLQAGAEAIVNPELYNSGIIRVCATYNPGKQVNAKGNYDMTNSSYDRWKDVGYCDDQKIRCWLDTSSVKNVIQNKQIEKNVLDEVNMNVFGEGSLDEDTSREKAKEGEKFIKEINNNNKINKGGTSKSVIDGEISSTVNELTKLVNLGINNKHKARGLYLLGKLYNEVAGKIIGAVEEVSSRGQAVSGSVESSGGEIINEDKTKKTETKNGIPNEVRTEEINGEG